MIDQCILILEAVNICIENKKFNMFSIRQSLSIGARLACTRYFSRYLYRYVPTVLSKVNDTVGFHHDRFIHTSITNLKNLDKLEGKMRLMFTCNKCKTRNNKLISKLAYYKGVIIVRCEGCKNNHLIADNLGWFTDAHKGTNIEKIMASKGESMRKITNDVDGYYEIVTNEALNLKSNSMNDATGNSSNNDECSNEIKKIGASNES